jgi:hypothetical protein
MAVRLRLPRAIMPGPLGPEGGRRSRRVYRSGARGWASSLQPEPCLVPLSRLAMAQAVLASPTVTSPAPLRHQTA